MKFHIILYKGVIVRFKTICKMSKADTDLSVVYCGQIQTEVFYFHTTHTWIPKRQSSIGKQTDQGRVVANTLCIFNISSCIRLNQRPYIGETMHSALNL